MCNLVQIQRIPGIESTRSVRWFQPYLKFSFDFTNITAILLSETKLRFGLFGSRWMHKFDFLVVNCHADMLAPQEAIHRLRGISFKWIGEIWKRLSIPVPKLQSDGAIP